MKSALVIDCDVNAATLPEYLRPAVQWRMVSKTPTPYLPAGTVFDERSPTVKMEDAGGGKINIPQALLLCQTGQAAAADQECADALGITPEQARLEQRRYRAAAAGIKGKNDLDLFLGEVIDGYEPGSTDANPIYKPGKYWKNYMAALSKKKEADVSDE